MSNIIGIDLGTTTSEIAYIKNGKPEIIADDLGNRIIPSVISFSRNREMVVGQPAYNQIISNPDNTVYEVKRHIGEDINIKLGEDEFLPHEISAILLREIKKYAERHLGEEVKEAVITVPANFTSHQRKLTQRAGELAGFKVERIINEPTAAAMAYGIDNLNKNANILVYDLGGGTFDVTVLEMFSGILDVKASRGNNRLGGKDFDERIEKYILEEFKKQYGKDLYDGLDNSLTISIKERVKEAAIKAKKELSVQMLTEINIPFITMINGAPISINIEFTRAKFDELTKDLVLSTKDTVNKALKASGLNKEEIDIVLLIGGSSRIVAVKDLVDKMFPNKVKSTINPDEAVAMGAAIQAGIKTGQISSENSLIVTDKCNYNLGTSVVSQVGDKLVEGVFDCIIPVDSSIPCSKKHIYTTVYDNQTSVNIEVYEGYAPLVHENKKIDGFKLMGIPKAYAGEESIEIEFSYDLNGTLEVKATIVSTGKTITKVIDNSMIIKSSGNLEKYMVNRVDLDGWSECELAQVVKRTVELAEKKMKKLEGHKVNDLRPLLDKLKQAVIDGNEELVEKYDEELTEILFNM